MKHRRYSKEQLITLLQKWEQQHGQIPKRRLLSEDADMPSDMTFRVAFGSWGNALRAAGFKPVKWIPSVNGHTRKGIRNIVRAELLNHHGYIQIFEPTHPMAMKNGYVLLHRKLAYDAGLLTDRCMEINHINGNKQDNRLENFEILTKVAHAHISTPLGTKRPRHNSKPCKYCPTLTASKYGLCKKHYKLEWQRGNIYEKPELLRKAAA